MKVIATTLIFAALTGGCVSWSTTRTAESPAPSTTYYVAPAGTTYVTAPTTAYVAPAGTTVVTTPAPAPVYVTPTPAPVYVAPTNRDACRAAGGRWHSLSATCTIP